jgi:hypothetical protein
VLVPDAAVEALIAEVDGKTVEATTDDVAAAAAVSVWVSLF